MVRLPSSSTTTERNSQKGVERRNVEPEDSGTGIGEEETPKRE